MAWKSNFGASRPLTIFGALVTSQPCSACWLSALQESRAILRRRECLRMPLITASATTNSNSASKAEVAVVVAAKELGAVFKAVAGTKQLPKVVKPRVPTVAADAAAAGHESFSLSRRPRSV